MWTYFSPQPVSDLKSFKQLLLDFFEVTELDTFLSPPHPADLPPELIGIDSTQLKTAAGCVLEEIKNNGTILIYGDYDADGISATAVLTEALTALGAEVVNYIPNRFTDGYGLSHAALDSILLDPPALIITVDNGIVAIDEAKRIGKAGVKLIITDHHQPANELPPATAIVHSTKLCGASVAWFLAKTVVEQAESEHDLDQLLDLVGIATIADQVPLRDANRSFAYHGLQALRQTNRPGLLALYHVTNVEPTKLDTYHVNFQIAPRINAMGRLTSGQAALELLLSTDQAAAENQASQLSITNTQRQELTFDSVQLAMEQAEEQSDQHLIVVYSTEFHEGVVGLVAGRLMEKLHKPVIAISVGETESKGSVRSIHGIDITTFLRQSNDKFLSLGGHPMAAGFSINTNQLSEVTKHLQDRANTEISPDQLIKEYPVLAPLTAGLINHHTIQALNKLAPFGAGHRRPLVGLQDFKVIRAHLLGAEGLHSKALLVEQGSNAKPIEVVHWNSQISDQLQPGDIVSVIGLLQERLYNGQRYVQLKAVDWNLE